MSVFCVFQTKRIQMNKGSQLRYERRGGQWVEKTTNEPLRSINDGLSPIDCIHEWGPYNGPIPTIAEIVPTFRYACKKCNVQLSTKISLPLPSAYISNCKHVFQNDPKLGEAYAHYLACFKCGEQKYT
jgi:hypothetical protein